MEDGCLQVYADGGSRGNPGIAGCGVCVLDSGGNELLAIAHPIGIATNNQAEYTGAIIGIREAIGLGAMQIDLFMDSELVIRQLQGIYRVKNVELKKMYEQIQALLRDWEGMITFNAVRREFNSRADELSNEAMDKEERTRKGR